MNVHRIQGRLKQVERELNMNYIKLISLLAIAYCPMLFAQIEDDIDELTDLYDDEELIRIATGTEKQVRFAPSVASVITQQDIKNAGALTLDQALEMVPGLHVSNSFNRQDAIYSIRGIHTGQNPQVLVLIDGVRMSQLFTGARPFNYQLPVNNIERIEVIRGPGSAVYGADAFAGVISVTTKTHSGLDGWDVGTRIGSFQNREAWLRMGRNFGDLQVNLSIDYASSDGDRDRLINSDAQSLLLPNVVRNSEVSLAPGPLENRHEMWNSKLNISTAIWELDTFSWNLVDAGVGSGAAQALDPEGFDENDYYGSNFLIKPIEFGNAWTFNGNLGFTVLDLDAHFVLFPPGAGFCLQADYDPEVPSTGPINPNNCRLNFEEGVIGNPSYIEKTTFGEVVSTYAGEAMNIRVAVGFRNQAFEASESKNFVFGPDYGVLIDVSGTSEVYIRDDEREHYYVSLQNEWAFADDWELTAGIRYDSFTQFGDSVNPRIALVWATTHNLTTKLLYGRAFRAPSFSELFAENNPSLIGNANLKPEIIDTLEVAFDYHVNRDLNFRLNLFSYQIEDLVEINFGAAALNSGRQSGKGLEFESKWNVTDSISLSGNYAWQDAEDKTMNADVPNAAQQQLYLTAAWQLSDHLTLSGVLNYVADRRRVDGDIREDIDDNKTLDLVLRSHRAIRGLDVSLIARNVLDSDVREPSTGQFPAMPEIPDDYPLDGRSINLSFEYHFDR